MVERIFGLFIKGELNFGDRQIKKKCGAFCAVIGIVCNVILFVMKFLVGTSIGSVSIIADAFNNLSDSGSNIVMIFSFSLSAKPADKEHPYGHGRIEYLTSLIIGVIIMVMAFELGKESVGKILRPSELGVSTAAFVVLLISMAIKLSLTLFYKKAGKKMNSQTISAAAFDSFADVVASIVIIITLLIEKFAHKNVDGIAGVLVAIFIFTGGFRICKEAIDSIIGEPIDAEIANKIKAVIFERKEILSVHDLVIHSYGADYSMASIETDMDSALTFVEAHSIANKIEAEVKDRLGIELLIHMEPCITGNKEINSVGAVIDDILKALDPEIHKNGLEINKADNAISFEIEISHKYDNDKERQLVASIERMLLEQIPEYKYFIIVDKDFTKSN